MFPRCTCLFAAMLTWLLASGWCAAAQFGAGPRRVVLVSERLGLNRGTTQAARPRLMGKRRALELRRAEKTTGAGESTLESALESPPGHSLGDWEFRRQTRPEMLRQLSRRSSKDAHQREAPVPASISLEAAVSTSAPLNDGPGVEPLMANSGDWLLPSRGMLLPAELGPGT